MKLLIIDLNNLIYRNFYGIGPLFSKKGIQTNAVYGTYRALKRLIYEFGPSHVLIAKDSKPTKRLSISSDYKANRSSPEGLPAQKKIIDDLLKVMNLPEITVIGSEADDIIGSAAVQWQRFFESIVIVSADKDLYQLVGDNVFCYNDMTKTMYDSKAVMDKFGVEPSQIRDYLSLLGDTSDNVKGVMGIGKKTAVKLLSEYGDIDSIYLNIDELKGKLKEKLIKGQLDSVQARKLISLELDLEIGEAEFTKLKKAKLSLFSFLKDLDISL